MPRTSLVAIEAVINPPSAKSQRTPPPPSNPEVLDIMEFCGWARISRTMAFREIAAGRLIVRRIGDEAARSDRKREGLAQRHSLRAGAPNERKLGRSEGVDKPALE